eukprot:IDg21794t1
MDEVSRLRSKAEATARRQNGLFSAVFDRDWRKTTLQQQGASPIPPPENDQPIEVQQFKVPPLMQRRIRAAIRDAPKGKATGSDRLFVEMFQIVPSLAARLIYIFWCKCGELGAIPEQWTRVLLFPIHKKGSRRLPENYRPIALLSHMRKVVEKAIDREVRNYILSTRYSAGSGQIAARKLLYCVFTRQ